ncbi:hypothetical protein FPSE5266_02891 [Fusarium pseudograminearum]|nr:hypothetical protein FPSE5266_02891 [Fusarium pseudograminearum]
MASPFTAPVGEETAEMLHMKLNLLNEKIIQQENKLPALAADVAKKLAGNISVAERERQEQRASDACHRIRTMQREYDELWQRWYKMLQQEGNVDGNKLELEMKKNDEMRLEQEERWEMLDRNGDYFKTRWG